MRYSHMGVLRCIGPMTVCISQLFLLVWGLSTSQRRTVCYDSVGMTGVLCSTMLVPQGLLLGPINLVEDISQREACSEAASVR